MTDHILYIKNPDVVVREEDSDGALIFNPDTDQIRVLNSTGLFVWEMCDGSNDLHSILSDMSESFDEIPENTVAEDVKAFIEEMIVAGFIGVIQYDE